MSKCSLSKTHFLDECFWAWLRNSSEFQIFCAYFSECAIRHRHEKTHSLIYGWTNLLQMLRRIKGVANWIGCKDKYKSGCPGQHGMYGHPTCNLISAFCSGTFEEWTIWVAPYSLRFAWLCVTFSFVSSFLFVVLWNILSQEGKRIGCRGWRRQLSLDNLTYFAVLLKWDLRSAMNE